MRNFLLIMLLGFFIAGCIIPPGQVKKQSGTGQTKKLFAHFKVIPNSDAGV